MYYERRGEERRGEEREGTQRSVKESERFHARAWDWGVRESVAFTPVRRSTSPSLCVIALGYALFSLPREILI